MCRRVLMTTLPQHHTTGPRIGVRSQAEGLPGFRRMLGARNKLPRRKCAGSLGGTNGPQHGSRATARKIGLGSRDSPAFGESRIHWTSGMLQGAEHPAYHTNFYALGRPDNRPRLSARSLCPRCLCGEWSSRDLQVFVVLECAKERVVVRG